MESMLDVEEEMDEVRWWRASDLSKNWSVGRYSGGRKMVSNNVAYAVATADAPTPTLLGRDAIGLDGGKGVRLRLHACGSPSTGSGPPKVISYASGVGSRSAWAANGPAREGEGRAGVHWGEKRWRVAGVPRAGCACGTLGCVAGEAGLVDGLLWLVVRGRLWVGDGGWGCHGRVMRGVVEGAPSMKTIEWARKHNLPGLIGKVGLARW